MQDGALLEVQDTNLEAMKAKCSAINLGYLVDLYAECFVTEHAMKDITINRGYWSRTLAIQQTCRNFLTKQGDHDTLPRQIVNLGCGYDTLYYNLNTEKDKSKYAPYDYIEIDLDIVIKNKIKFINKSEKLKASLSEEIVEPSDTLLTSKNYTLSGCDLRDIELLREKLSGFSAEAPTLIFTECVMAYITPTEIDALLKFLIEKFENFQFMDYEMFNGQDRFGKMMVKNFQERGCPLKGIAFFPSLAGIKDWYLNAGYDSSKIHDMWQVYYSELPAAERTRIEKLQWLDEFEEFMLMQQHYFISVSTKVTNKDCQLMQAIFETSWVGNCDKK